MKAFGIIAKSLFVFLILKFVTQIILLFLFNLFPAQIESIFSISRDNTQMINVHVVNISTLVSSVLTLYIFYIWHPLRDLEQSDNWKRLGIDYILLALFMGFLGVFFNSFILSFFESDYSQVVELSRNLIATGWVGVVAAVIVVPIVEEIVFRKICITALLSETNPFFAILLSSLLFGILHIQPVQILGATILGMIFGSIYYFSKSILPSILIHTLNNAFFVVTLYATPKGEPNFLFEHNTLSFWLAFLFVSILFFGVAYVLYQKSKKVNSSLS